MMATAGQSTQGKSAIARMFDASWSMTPQLGVDPENPSPTNDNVASAYALFILLLSIASAVFYLRSVRTQEAVRPS